MRVADALRTGADRLAAACIDDPARDARWLLAHVLGVEPGRMAFHRDDALTPAQSAQYDAALTARAGHQPVAQIIGTRLFWGRAFRVTPDVLDPRPETETLVELALEKPFATVLDLGTGTGAIFVTLLAERPIATGLATDLSTAALAVAQANAETHGATPRASFVQADWFSGITDRFDLITSNPPYITAAEMANLAPDVRDWEPHLALTPGGDGLAAYRAIAAGARTHLAPGGRLLVEIGHQQGPAVAALFQTAGLTDIRVHPDLGGRDRVVSARAP